MKLPLVWGILACVSVVANPSVHGQTYPTKPVRFVVPFVPGVPTDIQGRMLGEKLDQRLSQQVIIDNRGGAGGNIAARLVAGAPSDGYTLLVNTAAEFSTYVKADVAEWTQFVKTAGVTAE